MHVCCNGIDDVLLDHPVCPSPYVGCSVMEQKIDRLTEMTAELTRRLQRDVGERGPARAF